MRFFSVLRKWAAKSSGRTTKFGKLQGEGPPVQVQMVWTTGMVEPGDKWIMGPRMVTIIHLSADPNPWIDPPTLQQP